MCPCYYIFGVLNVAHKTRDCWTAQESDFRFYFKILILSAHWELCLKNYQFLKKFVEIEDLSRWNAGVYVYLLNLHLEQSGCEECHIQANDGVHS